MSDNFKIKDIPMNERPTERLLRYGSESLANNELLAIILRSGSKNENILQICSRILSKNGGIDGLFSCGYKELVSIKGIGDVKAAQLIAVSELCRRHRSFRSGMVRKITSPNDAADYVMEEMREFKKEYLKIILLNTKKTVITVKDISIGSLNSSIVHPREVFVEAIKQGAESIIVCHNHPSGDPTPSKNDINVTFRLKECGKLLGIDIIDHLIIGDRRYVSLKERGII